MTQLFLDDPQIPLNNVQFLILDIETTGLSPTSCEITEIAAVVVRDGQIVDSYQTLVSIDAEIPAYISEATGIYSQMLTNAPKLPQVLDRFLEFATGSVIVGHNIRFDLGFIIAAFEQLSLRFNNESPIVDTLHLAKKLLTGEVSNFKLETLARELHLDHTPSHRAMPDVLATVDLLFYLIDRASSYGVETVEELLELPHGIKHRSNDKVKITKYIPRLMGVYWMANHLGQVIYVGKSNNLNARYRSYFTSDGRKMATKLLSTMKTYSYVLCKTELEALLLEARLVQALQPQFNTLGKVTPLQYCFIQTNMSDNNYKARVQRVRANPDNIVIGPGMIGPFRSMKSAKSAAFALHKAQNAHKEPHDRTSWTNSTSITDINSPDQPSSWSDYPNWLSTNLRYLLLVLSRQEQFEAAEELRLGSKLLIDGLIRSLVLETFAQQDRLEIFSSRNNVKLEIRKGRACLDISSVTEITLEFNGFTGSSSFDLDNIIGNSKSIASVPKSLETFEELWIVWKTLRSSKEWVLLDETSVVAKLRCQIFDDFEPHNCENNRQKTKESLLLERISPS